LVVVLAGIVACAPVAVVNAQLDASSEQLSADVSAGPQAAKASAKPTEKKGYKKQGIPTNRMPHQSATDRPPDPSTGSDGKRGKTAQYADSDFRIQANYLKIQDLH
jgi:hypothetical protein